MRTDDADRPSLLVVRTGMRQFREYLLSSIHTKYRVHMIMGVEPTWELAYISGWTLVEQSLDVPTLVAAARDIDAQEHFDGVLCWDETRIVATAHVAKALGLPGGDPDAIVRCRDKRLTREALGAANVPQPGSVQVDSLEDALAAAERFGYPVILKPRDLALSIGVVKVDTPEELTTFYTYTSTLKVVELPDYRPPVLVEEYVPGEEISVDAAVHRGQVFPLVLARKEIGFPPYCVEVGHYVHGDDPLLDDPQLLGLLHDTHAALGFTDGVTHTEIKLSPQGPRIIEVNGRLGGDMIPYLGLRATGVDTGLAAAAVACGRPPAVLPDRKLVAGVRFFYPEQPDTVIESVRFDEDALPPAIDTLAILAAPGTTKSPPPQGIANGRVAFAVAISPTAQECRAALAGASVALRVNA
jgi:biotin carboxylase